VLIKINKISALTVHGIPTLLGNNGGVAPIVKKLANESGNNDKMMFYSTVHQESLCAESFSGIHRVIERR
jgi:hypothetical protein